MIERVTEHCTGPVQGCQAPSKLSWPGSLGGSPTLERLWVVCQRVVGVRGVQHIPAGEGRDMHGSPEWPWNAMRQAFGRPQL